MADSDVGGNHWGYLVNSNKTAAPLLEQLCLGLARIISGNGPEDKLTPERMAAFYRSVGGDFDGLYLGSNDTGSGTGSRFNSGLSFMYRTLGCYHSLEPTSNAFETPCVPCLTPVGYVRWQTLLLLLYPDEHASYLQKAVQKYDVPKPDGRLFPKSIPRDAFPEKPDVEMEKWHKKVTSQLTIDNMHHLKNSPYSSPVPQPADKSDGYFGPQIPYIRRPSRGSKDRLFDDDRRRPNLDSRRSSVPDFAPPASSAENGRPPSSYQRRDSSRRSMSAQRPGHHPRPRAATTGYSSHARNSSSSSQRDEYDRPSQGPQRQPPPYSRHHSNSKYKYPTADDYPSDEEASSEDSTSDRRRRRYESSPRDEFRRGALLIPVLNAFSTKRRHSHDAGVLPKADRPRRNETRSSRNTPPESSVRSPHAVHFKEDMFRDEDDTLTSPILSASSRRSETFPRSPASNDAMYGSPMARDNSSGSGSERRNGQESYRRGSRSKEVPLRVSTVTGVGGRRYANAEPKNGLSSGPDTPQRDPRMRYSVVV